MGKVNTTQREASRTERGDRERGFRPNGATLCCGLGMLGHSLHRGLRHKPISPEGLIQWRLFRGQSS